MTRRSRAASGPLAAALAAALIVWAPSARAQDAERYDHAALEAQRPAELQSAPEPDDPFLAEGQRIYLRSCAPCHGDTGAGDGLVADFMRPRPRDFTAANFAFRTTRSGELPTDADLFRVVSRGVPGTGMPAWGEGIFTLTEQERWQVVYFVKTLSGIFWDEYTNPYRSVGEGEPEPILEIGDAPERTDELLERGRELYLDQEAGGCVRCHGDDGRGDGEAAAEMYDDLGQPVRPYDLTNPWRNKNGTAVEDIYRTLSTGISGTPMPDFMDGIPEDRDRWALAYYARSLLEERDVSSGALHARRVDGELPDDPDDRAWDSCEPYGVAMMGEYALAPRWQNPSVDYVRLCALHNEHEIAIRVEWDDPFHDAQGGPEEPAPEEPPADPTDAGTLDDASLDPDAGLTPDAGAEETAPADETPLSPVEPSGDGSDDEPSTTYISVTAMNARAQAGPIPDRMVLSMPAGRRAPEEAQRPHMFMGDEAHPVHAWMWDATGGGRFAEGGGTGPREEYVAQPPDAVQIHGTSRWHRGRWRVVFRRDLGTPDVEDDAQIEAGGLVPFALRVWDGSAGERGLQSATSSWHYMVLEMPTPPRAYLLGLVATCVIYLLICLAWWLTRGNGGGDPPPRTIADARTTCSKNGLASCASSSIAEPIFPRTLRRCGLRAPPRHRIDKSLERRNDRSLHPQ